MRQRAAGWVPGLAAAGIGAQVCYPLLAGSALRAATQAGVLLLAAAAVAHVARAGGWRAAVGLVAVAGGIGWAAEVIGVHTGVPFGRYQYAGSLGPELLGVPLLVPPAWIMMSYPCLLLGRAARHRPADVALTGGLALASWDLFLDPQMVSDGHWTWRDPRPALPGVPDVPLTNYAGWILVAVLLVAALHRALPTVGEGSLAFPAAVLGWTWAGSVLGNLVFFGRPWVALYGGLVMGAFVVPFLRRWAASRTIRSIGGVPDVVPDSARAREAL